LNERIKQLWEEAAKTTQSDSWEEQTKFMERFAELIVQECLEELRYTVLDTQELRRDKSTDYQVGWEDGMFDAGETIKNIFGVEE
jgi:leucyl aminopeptidase (aminopeptidase T)